MTDYVEIEDFSEFIKEKYNSSYSIINENKTNLFLKHSVCEYEFDIKKRNIRKRGTIVCPICKPNRWTKETLNYKLKESKIVLNDEVIVNSETVHSFKHIDCGYDFSITPATLLKKATCPHCSGGKFVNTEPKTKDIINSEEGYEYIGIEGTSRNKKVVVLHKDCGHQYPIKIWNWNRGDRCPNCKIQKITVEAFISKVNEIEGYTFVDSKVTMVNYKEKFKVLHDVCGNVNETSYDNFVSKERRCPDCADANKSYASTRIREYLQKSKIPFSVEYVDDRCRHINTLRFDFMIQLDNKKLLIEYDGSQHFKPTFGSGIDERTSKLKITQHRDSVKNRFCEENSGEYTLERINYQQNEIEELERILLKYNLIKPKKKKVQRLSCIRSTL